MVTRLEVDVQSVEIGHVNLAKFWLKYVSFPWLSDLAIQKKRMDHH